MQFCVMMQTSFDANLVRAELSDVGVARALTLFERKNFFRLLVFQIFFAYHESGSLCPSNGTSNLMIAFSHRRDKTLFLDTAQKSIPLFRSLPP